MEQVRVSMLNGLVQRGAPIADNWWDTTLLAAFLLASRPGKRPSDVERRLRRERKTEREEGRCRKRLDRPWVDWKPPGVPCKCCGKVTGGCFFPPCGGDEGFFICKEAA